MIVFHRFQRLMLVQFTINFGDSHLAGNGGLGEKVTVKTVILEFVELLWTQKGRDGITKVSDCHVRLRIKSNKNYESQ